MVVRFHVGHYTSGRRSVSRRDRAVGRVGAVIDREAPVSSTTSPCAGIRPGMDIAPESVVLWDGVELIREYVGSRAPSRRYPIASSDRISA